MVEIMASSSNIYIFDLQTRKTYEDVGGKKGIAQMGISFAALLNHQTDELELFTEKEVTRLIDKILSSQLIVGLNLKKFSYKVLSSFGNTDFQKIRSLDILDYLRKKIVLKPCIEDLFLGTLGINKSLDNMKITRLFKLGKTEEVKQITIQNVKALNSVYSFGKEKGHVFLNDRTGQRWKISVSW